jgi:hypothetical protein
MSDDNHDPESAAGDRARLADAARRARETSQSSREAAAKTRWRSRKARLRSKRVRESVRTGPRTLEEFVEVASLDELVNVLVDLAEPDEHERPGDNR